MATLISAIETTARLRLVEATARFWTSAELVEIIIAGIRDLWRDTVDLKGEHYLFRDNSNVWLPANTSQLSNVPTDVHKIYLIEPRDVSGNSSNEGLSFQPLDYNDPLFNSARTRSAIDPSDDVIYYSITGQGAPVNAPVILVAPQSNSNVNLSFCYIRTLGNLVSTDQVPIPGEADNALVAWTVAYARAKDREDRSPDANWLAIYATEKEHLLQSLGLRQLQEPEYVSPLFQSYW